MRPSNSPPVTEALPNRSLATEIDALVGDAIARRIFPGAVVLVARGDKIVHWGAYGTTVYEPAEAQPIARDTMYDIASLTKMFTATVALRLADAGLLDLDAPVARYLPDLHAAQVTITHLLTHTSGLDIRLSVLREQGAAGIWRTVYELEPARPPGTAVAYTNVNSLLLGAIVEQCVGAPLDRAFGELIVAPLGLRDTGFCPPVALRGRIAPTEHDPEWRGGLVHGTVHDESAHALGGIAGHAGLFSSAGDLWQFCRMWLRAAAGETSLLAPATARRALSNCTPDLPVACGLGWMLDRVNFMGTVPAGAAGHTGFTGPAMVLLPAEQLAVIMLSNRVYPRRSPAAHHGVTAAVVAAARRATGAE